MADLVVLATNVLPNDLIWTGKTYERVLHTPFIRTWGPKKGYTQIVLTSHVSYSWAPGETVYVIRKTVDEFYVEFAEENAELLRRLDD